MMKTASHNQPLFLINGQWSLDSLTTIINGQWSLDSNQRGPGSGFVRVSRGTKFDCTFRFIFRQSLFTYYYIITLFLGNETQNRTGENPPHRLAVPLFIYNYIHIQGRTQGVAEGALPPPPIHTQTYTGRPKLKP